MPDSAAKRAVFLWLPKCAGTSVAQLCWDHDLLIDPMIVDELFHERYVNVDDQPDAYTFAFVRSPWDRIVSSYTMFATDRRPAALSPPSFRDFLDIVEHEPLVKRPYDAEIWDLPDQAAELTSDELSAHYRRSIKNHSGTFIDPFYKLFGEDGTQQADFIGRYEQLDSDVARVFSLLGVADVRLPHLNARAHQAHKRYYDAETRAVVARLFKEEIEILGYASAP